MAYVVFSRRGVHVMPPNASDLTALLVPSDDQIVALRDLTAGADEIAARLKSEGRTPLWREKRGQILVYGFLPAELKEARRALRVWLAEDFAPTNCSAFFFVFGTWVVHGIKEIDDERREVWRSATLSYTSDKLAAGLTEAVADLLLRFPAREICVAVDGALEKFETIKHALDGLGVSVTPFAALQPDRRLQPLYRHRDFTLPMVLSVGFLLVLFVGMLGYLLINYVESSRLKEKITQVQQQIRAIQISQSLGYIREPQPLLSEMRKTFDRPPSAILDAAARYGRVLGELEQVQFTVAPGADAEAARSSGLIGVDVKLAKVYDKLLVNQETTARQQLANAPWVRSVASVPAGSDTRLRIIMQVTSPPGSNIPSATTNFQPVLPPPADISESTR